MDQVTFKKLRKILAQHQQGKPNTFRFLCVELGLWGLLLGGCFHLVNLPGGLVCISPLVATLMFRHFAIMHDCVHNAFFSGKKAWNNWLGNLSAIICYLPFEPWRKVHLEHHYWSGNVDRDPVMALIHAYPKWPLLVKRICDFLWRSWIPVLAFLQYGVFWLVCFKRSVSGKGSLHMRLSSVLPPLFWGTLVFSLPSNILFFTLIPGVIFYLVMVEVVNLPHHLELPKLQGSEVLKAREQYWTARSCEYPKWVAEHVTLNFNYHIEHHLFPQEPWYKLASIAQSLKPQLGKKYNSDPLFAWIMKSKKLDLETVLKAQGIAHCSDEKLVA